MSMIHPKQFIGNVLVSLLALGLIGPILPSREATERPDCLSVVDAIEHDIYRRYSDGTGEWEDLEARVADAHACFGESVSPLRARLPNYETFMLVEQRRFAEAEEVFVRFFREHVDIAEPRVVAKMHLRRGYVYSRLGWTAEALGEYGQAALLVDRLPAPEAAYTLSDVGERYRNLNELEAADEYFAAAESLFVQVEAEDPGSYGPDLERVRMRRARVFLAEGARGFRPEREAVERAARLLESANEGLPATPPHAPLRAHTLLTLAEVHRLRDEPERALSTVREVHRFRSWFENAYPQLVAYLWREEAYALTMLGRHDDARQAYERALAAARTAGAREEMIPALIGLGEVSEAAGRGVNADSLRRAERYFHEAAALAEDERRTYGTHHWSASAWDLAQEPYHHLVRVLLRQGRTAEAFQALDATRARYLRDLRTTSQLRTNLDVDTAARLDSLSHSLDEVRQALQRGSLPIEDRSALETQEVMLQQAMDEIRGVPDQEPAPLSLEAIQRALRPRGQVLLTYFLDEALPTAFVVRPDTFVALPLAVQTDTLHAQIQRLGWLQDGVETHLAGFRLTPLHALYESLYAPIAPLIPTGAPVVVVPAPPLDQVPFGLLLAREHPPYAYGSAPYLLRNHPIAVELAASLLVQKAPTGPPPTLNLLALGRSRFGPTSPAGLDLPHLPNVASEVKRLGRHVPNARLAFDEDASEGLFDDHRGDARILHLASHALIDPRLPLYSRIILWDDPAASDDGVLHLYELYDRPLNASLVTLSGCRTARGRQHVGEGMMGLQYAFRAAGAQATVATLWQVDDAATGRFMEAFYKHLRAGLPKDEALRQAQLTYLATHDGLHASPFYWGASVLYGDPAPVDFAHRTPRMAVWGPLGLLLAIIGLIVPRLRLHLRSHRSSDG